MANKKVSALALIVGASISATDVVPIVDMDVVTPTTYKAQAAQLRSSLFKASGIGWSAADYLQLGGGTVLPSGVIRVAQGAVAVDSPLLNSTVEWNAGTTVMRHVLVDILDTASNANSQLVELRVGGVAKWRVSKAGDVVQGGNLTVGGGTVLQALTATTGAFGGGVVRVAHATAPYIVLDTTSGAITDNTQLLFQRGALTKWRIGVNIAGGNNDRFDIYHEASGVTALAFANATGAATFGTPLTAIAGITVTTGGIHVMGVGGGNILHVDGNAAIDGGLSSGNINAPNITLTAISATAVSAGASDSAGVGFRWLRVPN